MRYFLDTNICIYLIKRQSASVLARFNTLSVGDMGISSNAVSGRYEYIAKVYYL